MSVILTTPEPMQPAPYHHVAIATGTRQVHVAGQIGRDSSNPGDLAGQVAQALRNTAHGLAGAGAGFADVVRLTFYVTRWNPEQMNDFMAGIDAVAPDVGLPQPMPPASLIGVECLFEPDVLVEVEATAVID
ncbi:Enamine deaminase RidA, house cleaning of reactive enamine intermediates, YjgF/YER057c/UK114 family [Brevibacterium sandarakinum]|uniref:Enamine deaminase RidA, house cleaning of reactive enamine intermediates, YjgF/YER057c/UK114 family n=1 Tax=Brevibacterium sandarakinum TaxID=629680 RepID=A0A1H1XFX7_BRESA|nr:RidA family protein [Brevibacterium sandarakinum]SDT08071.1 Enamine deaminase RidA, house cleaning of reactive enamine intermediates, YjgF/YER057c/UK114 family [Brevibacterium sandarakinum]